MMEMGALALGSGAVVGGIFGMNLTHGLEEHPHGDPLFCLKTKSSVSPQLSLWPWEEWVS